jgi:hypothetical protein
MGADKALLAAWLSNLAGTLVTDALDAQDLADRLSATPALEGVAFASKALSIMRVIAESVSEPSGFDAIAMPSAEDAETLAAAGILVVFGLSIAAPRISWISRPQARAARSRIASHGDTALASISARGAEMVDLYRYLARIIEIAVLIVSEQAANAVPIVRVETGISLPSTVIAYHLYGDAARAQGVVDIARSTTPMLMPVGFEALEN